jgi:hypothetical protein
MMERFLEFNMTDRLLNTNLIEIWKKWDWDGKKPLERRFDRNFWLRLVTVLKVASIDSPWNSELTEPLFKIFRPRKNFQKSKS